MPIRKAMRCSCGSSASRSATPLWIAAAQSDIPQWLAEHPEGEGAADSLAGVRRRLARVPGARFEVIEDAAHMVHHDQPERVAAAIESFVAAAHSR